MSYGKKLSAVGMGAILLVGIFAGCAPEQSAHEHTFAETWTTSETEHWHAATCEHRELTSGKAAHAFEGNVCTVCGYEKEEEPDVKPTEKYEPYDYVQEHKSEGRFLGFYSSDPGLDAFLNDYTVRHMRDTADRIHTHPVGAGSSAWKEWESMAGCWWDASDDNGTMSNFYATKRWVRDWLLAPTQDGQGYVWADNGALIESWSMGWQFPDYTQGGLGWTFDSDGDAEGWESNGNVNVSGGFLTASGVGDTIELTSPTMGVSTLTSPFLRMSFSYSGSDVEDLYIYYQTNRSPETWSEERKVSFSEFCTTGYPIGTAGVSFGGRFFPMYLKSDWGKTSTRRATKIKIVLKGKDGAPLSGDLRFDYIATEFDDRQPLNPCNYIIAAKNLLEFSQSKSDLEAMLPHARAAMNFLLGALEGKDGLISTDYLVGHYNNGEKAVGTGLGDGYWDVLAFPKVNLYCNISFYNALVAMKYLEEMAEHYGVELAPTETVNRDMNGTDVYAETAASLSALAETCRDKIRTTFWNEETGRFHVGKRDNDIGSIQDNGYLMFNQQVIAAGIATEEQERSILAWINGERTVSGDKSSGEDIYRFEFAPRFNTAEIGGDFYYGYSATFNGNVQNGGTALHLAYYDVVSQSRVDLEKGYSRLDAIRKWYEKVKAAGGSGWDFYREYYKDTGIPCQGGPSGGLIGLDYEFLEAAILFKAVPDSFFGLGADSDGTLTVTPSFPEELDYWRMENLTFAGSYYDVAIGKYFAQIADVAEYSEGSGREAKVRLSVREPNFGYEVYLNGEKTENYTVENGRIVYTGAFGNVTLEVKGVQ